MISPNRDEHKKNLKPLIGVMIPFITSRGPPCSENPFLVWEKVQGKPPHVTKGIDLLSISKIHDSSFLLYVFLKQVWVKLLRSSEDSWETLPPKKIHPQVLKIRISHFPIGKVVRIYIKVYPFSPSRSKCIQLQGGRSRKAILKI